MIKPPGRQMADQVRPYSWGCARFVPGQEPPAAATARPGCRAGHFAPYRTHKRQGAPAHLRISDHRRR